MPLLASQSDCSRLEAANTAVAAHLPQGIYDPPHQLQRSLPVPCQSAGLQVIQLLLQGVQVLQHHCCCLGLHACTCNTHKCTGTLCASHMQDTYKSLNHQS